MYKNQGNCLGDIRNRHGSQIFTCRYNVAKLSLNNLYNIINCYSLSLFLHLNLIHFYKQQGRLPISIHLERVYLQQLAAWHLTEAPVSYKAHTSQKTC